MSEETKEVKELKEIILKQVKDIYELKATIEELNKKLDLKELELKEAEEANDKLYRSLDVAKDKIWMLEYEAEKRQKEGTKNGD